MSILSPLTRPRFPRTAFILDSHEMAAVELRRRGGRQFALTAAAYSALTPDLCAPAFEGRNIPNAEAFAEAIFRTVESAGLRARQRWSILLPEAIMRTVTVSFDSVPSSRAELAQTIAWKTERILGVKAADLRITRQLVGLGNSARFLVVAARKTVLEEYEKVIALLGWKSGVMLPRYMGEVAWCDWDGAHGDKLVVGTRSDSYMAAFVRGSELLFIRSIDNDPARFEDEIFRLALYYRDRLADTPESAAIGRVITNGPIDAERVSAVVGDALGTVPSPVRPVPDLIEMKATPESVPSLAAAAGIATQAWAR